MQVLSLSCKSCQLKKYTGSASKKTKRDSNKFKGWSKEGKAFMVKKLYKKICDAINKSDQIDQGSSSSDDKMDYGVLYAKV